MKIFLIAITLLAGTYVVTSAVRSQVMRPVGPESLANCLTTVADSDVCLTKTVDTLLDRYTTRQLMSYISALATTTPDEILKACHPIGHIIGQETYKRAGTIEGALALCSEDCRASCTHGVLGAGVLAKLGVQYPEEDLAHADDGEIKMIGAKYCDRDISLCHGIGHLLYILNGDGPKAFNLCDTISTGFKREVCYQGVYMERAGEKAGSTESLFPYKNSTTTINSEMLYPCTGVRSPLAHACFQFVPEYQKALFAERGIVSTLTMVQLSAQACNTLSEPARTYCYEGIGVQSGVIFGFSMEPAELQPLCDRFGHASDRASCTLGVIPRFIFHNQYGLNYCYGIQEKSRQALCYQAAFEWRDGYWAQSGSQTRFATTTVAQAMCGPLEVCSAQYKEYERIKQSLPDYRFGLYGEK